MLPRETRQPGMMGDVHRLLLVSDLGQEDTDVGTSAAVGALRRVSPTKLQSFPSRDRASSCVPTIRRTRPFVSFVFLPTPASDVFA